MRSFFQQGLTFARFVSGLAIIAAMLWSPKLDAADPVRRLLYVAEPGIRNYTEYGGHGVLVFDIDDGHRFVKRIPTGGIDNDGKPINVKGVAASAVTGRLYISTIRSLMCLDLVTEQLLWEHTYEFGCDRMALSPNGKVIYQPSYEKDDWYVLDARSGNEIARVSPKSGAHNTVYGSNGKFAYLAGLRSPFLTVASTDGHTVAKQIGSFSASVRPFTINHDQSLCFVNVNDLLGFEIGDLLTGQKLHRVEVTGVEKGKVKRHGCPSHGIGMNPDETEIWVSDGANSSIHIFDATKMPPEQIHSIRLRDQPGWVTFSIDGTFAYPSTGDVIDVKTRTIITGLTDEEGRMVQSEKMLEIDFAESLPLRSGNQFGIGMAGTNPSTVFSSWNEAIARFEKQDAENPTEPGGIVFVGSSSIRMWKLDESFPDLHVLNRGFGGSDMADSIHFIQPLVLRHKPRTVVVYAGDNDIARGKSASRVVADFTNFAAKIHSSLPDTKIVYLPVKPSIARWSLIDDIRKANDAIKQNCDKSEKLVYVDTFTPMLGEDGRPRPDYLLEDGLHMTSTGYEVWSNLVRPHLD